MAVLRPELSRKAEEILHVYGGVQGLASRPVWLVNTVLKTFFTEHEQSELWDYLYHGAGKEVRLLLRESAV